MKCPVVQIVDIKPHPDAHSLDIIEFRVGVERYWLVTGRHYNVGELGVFIPCGAIVPDDLAEEMWVKGKLGGVGRNVVTGVKKRGVWSNGLFYGQCGDGWHADWQLGQDVADELGIKFASLTEA